MINEAALNNRLEQAGELNRGLDSPSGPDAAASSRGPANGQPVPTWRRIEEYREMRELNQQLRDDVYGANPVASLWDEEGGA